MPDDIYIAPREVQRLVLCFDGAWDGFEERTNVARLHDALADHASGCPHQLKFYDAGITGRALGWRLDYHVLRGYSWIVNAYSAGVARHVENGEAFAAGPEIFIFGFSRGAYIARALAALIDRCGVLRSEHFSSASGGVAHPDAPLVRSAWELYRTRFSRSLDARYRDECVSFRERHSWNVKIRFVGVWETVGRRGVPTFSRSVLASMRYRFHDTALPHVVENACQALALDEHREDYAPALWTRKRPPQNVEQRWFPGSHGNVGGGYAGDRLAHAPLAWIAERAVQSGIEFADPRKLDRGDLPSCSNAVPRELRLRGDEYLWPVCDSYSNFMHGIYRLLRALFLRGRHWRPVRRHGIGETIDQSAYLKRQADAGYRPPNLVEREPDIAVTPKASR